MNASNYLDSAEWVEATAERYTPAKDILSGHPTATFLAVVLTLALLLNSVLAVLVSRRGLLRHSLTHLFIALQSVLAVMVSIATLLVVAPAVARGRAYCPMYQSATFIYYCACSAITMALGAVGIDLALKHIEAVSDKKRRLVVMAVWSVGTVVVDVVLVSLLTQGIYRHNNNPVSCDIQLTPSINNAVKAIHLLPMLVIFVASLVNGYRIRRDVTRKFCRLIGRRPDASLSQTAPAMAGVQPRASHSWLCSNSKSPPAGHEADYRQIPEGAGSYTSETRVPRDTDHSASAEVSPQDCRSPRGPSASGGSPHRESQALGACAFPEMEMERLRRVGQAQGQPKDRGGRDGPGREDWRPATSPPNMEDPLFLDWSDPYVIEEQEKRWRELQRPEFQERGPGRRGQHEQCSSQEPLQMSRSWEEDMKDPHFIEEQRKILRELTRDVDPSESEGKREERRERDRRRKLERARDQDFDWARWREERRKRDESGQRMPFRYEDLDRQARKWREESRERDEFELREPSSYEDPDRQARRWREERRDEFSARGSSSHQKPEEGVRARQPQSGDLLSQPEALGLQGSKDRGERKKKEECSHLDEWRGRPARRWDSLDFDREALDLADAHRIRQEQRVCDQEVRETLEQRTETLLAKREERKKLERTDQQWRSREALYSRRREGRQGGEESEERGGARPKRHRGADYAQTYETGLCASRRLQELELVLEYRKKETKCTIYRGEVHKQDSEKGETLLQESESVQAQELLEADRSLESREDKVQSEIRDREKQSGDVEEKQVSQEAHDADACGEEVGEGREDPTKHSTGVSDSHDPVSYTNSLESKNLEELRKKARGLRASHSSPEPPPPSTCFIPSHSREEEEKIGWKPPRSKSVSKYQPDWRSVSKSADRRGRMPLPYCKRSLSSLQAPRSPPLVSSAAKRRRSAGDLEEAPPRSLVQVYYRGLRHPGMSPWKSLPADLGTATGASSQSSLVVISDDSAAVREIAARCGLVGKQRSSSLPGDSSRGAQPGVDFFPSQKGVGKNTEDEKADSEKAENDEERNEGEVSDDQCAGHQGGGQNAEGQSDKGSRPEKSGTRGGDDPADSDKEKEAETGSKGSDTMRNEKEGRKCERTEINGAEREVGLKEAESEDSAKHSVERESGGEQCTEKDSAQRPGDTDAPAPDLAKHCHEHEEQRAPDPDDSTTLAGSSTAAMTSSSTINPLALQTGTESAVEPEEPASVPPSYTVMYATEQLFRNPFVWDASLRQRYGQFSTTFSPRHPATAVGSQVPLSAAQSLSDLLNIPVRDVSATATLRKPPHKAASQGSVLVEVAPPVPQVGRGPPKRGGKDDTDDSPPKLSASEKMTRVPERTARENPDLIQTTPKWPPWKASLLVRKAGNAQKEDRAGVVSVETSQNDVQDSTIGNASDAPDLLSDVLHSCSQPSACSPGLPPLLSYRKTMAGAPQDASVKHQQYPDEAGNCDPTKLNSSREQIDATYQISSEKLQQRSKETVNFDTIDDPSRESLAARISMPISDRGCAAVDTSSRNPAPATRVPPSLPPKKTSDVIFIGSPNHGWDYPEVKAGVDFDPVDWSFWGKKTDYVKALVNTPQLCGKGIETSLPFDLGDPSFLWRKDTVRLSALEKVRKSSNETDSPYVHYDPDVWQRRKAVSGLTRTSVESQEPSRFPTNSYAIKPVRSKDRISMTERLSAHRPDPVQSHLGRARTAGIFGSTSSPLAEAVSVALGTAVASLDERARSNTTKEHVTKTNFPPSGLDPETKLEPSRRKTAEYDVPPPLPPRSAASETRAIFPHSGVFSRQSLFRRSHSSMISARISPNGGDVTFGAKVTLRNRGAGRTLPRPTPLFARSLSAEGQDSDRVEFTPRPRGVERSYGMPPKWPEDFVERTPNPFPNLMTTWHVPRGPTPSRTLRSPSQSPPPIPVSTLGGKKGRKAEKSRRRSYSLGASIGHLTRKNARRLTPPRFPSLRSSLNLRRESSGLPEIESVSNRKQSTDSGDYVDIACSPEYSVTSRHSSTGCRGDDCSSEDAGRFSRLPATPVQTCRHPKPSSAKPGHRQSGDRLRSDEGFELERRSTGSSDETPYLYMTFPGRTRAVSQTSTTAADSENESQARNHVSYVSLDDSQLSPTGTDSTPQRSSGKSDVVRDTNSARRRPRDRVRGTPGTTPSRQGPRNSSILHQKSVRTHLFSPEKVAATGENAQMQSSKINSQQQQQGGASAAAMDSDAIQVLEEDVAEQQGAGAGDGSGSAEGSEHRRPSWGQVSPSMRTRLVGGGTPQRPGWLGMVVGFLVSASLLAVAYTSHVSFQISSYVQCDYSQPACIQAVHTVTFSIVFPHVVHCLQPVIWLCASSKIRKELLSTITMVRRLSCSRRMSADITRSADRSVSMETYRANTNAAAYDDLERGNINMAATDDNSSPL